MSIRKYPSNLGAVRPTGAYVFTPTNPPLPSRTLVLGSPLAINSPVPGGPGQTGGINLSGSGGLNGNPNYPCFAGAEILPLASTTVPIDLGTRYDFHHYLNPGSIGTQNGTAASTFANTYPGRQAHTVAYDLYPTGAELVNDDVRTYHLPIRRADLGAGAVTSAGTALAALQTPGGAYIIMDGSLANCFVNTWFDTSLLAAENPVSRVVRIGLRWLAWKDDSATPAPGEGLSVRELDTAVVAAPQFMEYGNWLVPDYERSAQFVTRWLGESNYLTRGQPLAKIHNRSPWTVNDLTHMEVADERLYFQLAGQQGFDSSQTNVYLDFLEMIVEVVPERRIGVANRIVSNLQPLLDFGYDWTNTVSWAYPLDTQYLVQLTGSAYTMTMRESIPADTSDRYRADPDGAFQYSFMEAIGPSLQLNGITQPRNTMFPQVDIDIGTVSDGVLVGVPQDFDEYNLAAAHFDVNEYLTAGAFWAAYEAVASPYVQSVSSTGPTAVTLTADGLTTFTRVKLLAVPDEMATADLTVTVSQGGVPLATASVSPATIRALDPVGEDWREFELILSVPVTPTSGLVTVTVSSTATVQNPWYLSAAYTLGRQQPFGYPNDGGPGVDYSVVLVCEPDEPPEPDVLVSTQELDGDASCGIESVQGYTLVWGVTTEPARYAVQRSLDDIEWDTVALIENDVADWLPGDLMTYTDYAAQWDVQVFYRIAAFRAADETITYGASTSAGVLSSQGAAIGISDGQFHMIYVPTVESGSLNTTWTDMTPSDLVQLHGENYSRALQAPEDRGLSFSQNVLVKHLFVCTDGEVEALTAGQRSMAPTPYDLLLYFSKLLYVSVRLPNGYSRPMKLQLGGLQVRNQFGVFMAEIVLTDVHVPDLDITEAP